PQQQFPEEFYVGVGTFCPEGEVVLGAMSSSQSSETDNSLSTVIGDGNSTSGLEQEEDEDDFSSSWESMDESEVEEEEEEDLAQKIFGIDVVRLVKCQKTKVTPAHEIKKLLDYLFIYFRSWTIYLD